MSGRKKTEIIWARRLKTIRDNIDGVRKRDMGEKQTKMAEIWVEVG